MNIENRCVKIYLKSLAPNEAIEKIYACNLPSPYKEVLIACCVMRKNGYPACDYLEQNYNIYLTYYTYKRRLRDALVMFRKSNIN